MLGQFHRGADAKYTEIKCGYGRVSKFRNWNGMTNLCYPRTRSMNLFHQNDENILHNTIKYGLI